LITPQQAMAAPMGQLWADMVDSSQEVGGDSQPLSQNNLLVSQGSYFMDSQEPRSQGLSNPFQAAVALDHRVCESNSTATNGLGRKTSSAVAPIEDTVPQVQPMAACAPAVVNAMAPVASPMRHRALLRRGGALSLSDLNAEEERAKNVGIRTPSKMAIVPVATTPAKPTQESAFLPGVAKAPAAPALGARGSLPPAAVQTSTAVHQATARAPAAPGAMSTSPASSTPVSSSGGALRLSERFAAWTPQHESKQAQPKKGKARFGATPPSGQRGKARSSATCSRSTQNRPPPCKRTCPPSSFGQCSAPAKTKATEVSPEDAQNRLAKRRGIVSSIKATADYVQAKRSRHPDDMPLTPDAEDENVSKRQWEASVMNWRHGLVPLQR